MIRRVFVGLGETSSKIDCFFESKGDAVGETGGPL